WPVSTLCQLLSCASLSAASSPTAHAPSPTAFATLSCTTAKPSLSRTGSLLWRAATRPCATSSSPRCSAASRSVRPP
ncbi:hypothetical protein DMC30DRAFT_395689, partial [Rhodotorula diobovata]